MAAIKPIEGRSVHQIQSGQVISEGLTSVVKELVENGLDAHATSIEVRFKNNGLDAIEVIDNGDGISPDNYESIALKHWTSKLTSYADLDSVTTFGFRGEALSSLCALSDLQIITAMASEAPKGTKLDFDMSGKLKSRTVTAAQKGTTVLVENILKTLPVRRKELERNIKREYTKVLGILQAYAGVCVGVKFSVFNQPAKGRRAPVFATKGNPTVRENISNVFGAKALSALVPMNLEFEMKPTRKGFQKGVEPQEKVVKIVGFISRPVVGEGRLAPDRQMFFVNGRPCILPQVARAINEVYKHFNVTQSPFIFADIRLDTNAYDVNVSPDKRTILLHDQAEMMESLKVSLADLFDHHEQTVPNSMTQTKTQNLKQMTLDKTAAYPTQTTQKVMEDDSAQEDDTDYYAPPKLLNVLSSSPSRAAAFNSLSLGQSPAAAAGSNVKGKGKEVDLVPSFQSFKKNPDKASGPSEEPDSADAEDHEDMEEDVALPPLHLESQGFMSRASTSAVPTASYRSPRRPQQGTATIKIGDREPVTAGGNSPPNSPSKRRKVDNRSTIGRGKKTGISKFSSALGRFAAPGTKLPPPTADDEESEEDQLMDEDEDSPAAVGDNQSDGEAVQGDEAKDAAVAEAMMLDRDEQDDGTISVIEIMAAEPPTEDDTPLFLPNPNSDAGSDDDPEEEEDKEATPKSPADDEEYIDEHYISEEQNRQQSTQKAARLLKEAEEKSAQQPTTEALERALRILEDSHKLSTKNTVRFVSTSVTKLQDRVHDLSKAPTATAAKHVAVSPTQNKSSSSTNLEEPDTLAEARLNLTVTKQDFLEMQIKGQFNKGFILATRADDLFIIDQHASDEKYNFEKLQEVTVVQNQRLVVPKKLGLMAMDELVVIDHNETFRKNGFVIEVQHDAPVGEKCRLVSLPMSKETVFGLDDLEELIHLINEDPGNPSVRCSKVRKMFAMRACRKSVMVGRALTKKGMEVLVKHMGELDKPWNCPHGRPTMRHLSDLDQASYWRGRDQDRDGGLKWGSDSWAETWLALEAPEDAE
ncbi:DNA mismatch repair protein MutL [Choiromyces venosus 120613-1]|uniref:DNA mismatch repair protein PMS1 n=1 Tax=Choiromyces venosus 120613-1 TaxID=1336337 RepID=A0A3N4JDI9_9PEZI|nr:DNA mismatch repair protein MutL [Choiromyces venosus 120613-1]